MSAAQESHGPRIVVGVDGSACSVEALRWAVRQAGFTGGSVDAVLAWQYPTSYGGWAWVPYGFAEGTDFEKLAEKTLNDAIGQARSPGRSVTVCPQISRGHPVQVLLDAAKGADLLVVGSRGHGEFADALLGSVSQQCVHHASCPVVVIRGAARSAR
jgi:nucleotide-binding universal stress UspA family protein